MRVILLLALLLFPQGRAPSVEQREVFLEPDYGTLVIQGYRTAHEPCTAWPIREGEPLPYYMRGLVRDADGWAIGRYLARGVLKEAEGANYTEYEIYIKGLPKIMYGLDAEPLVYGYSVYSGAIELTPLLKPGCPWGLGWRLLITQ